MKHGIKTIRAGRNEEASSKFTLISQYMDINFSLRRKELVENEPSVKDTLQRWPAFFLESQVINTHLLFLLFLSFHRLLLSSTTLNQKPHARIPLDKHTSCFLEIFESKKGTAGKKFLLKIKSAVSCFLNSTVSPFVNF